LAYDFPASPTNGQIVTFGSTAWQWNGTAWLMQSGNVGPAGPAGADGAPGAQGPAGPTGPAGPVGEAPNDGQQYARQSLAWSPFTIPAPAPQVGLVDVGDTPPASPLDRQQFWKSDDGTMWLRYNDGTGPPQWVQTNAQPTPASVITEQFIDLSGAATMDIQVPSWAKGVDLEISAFVANGTYVAMRLSVDGTTFLAGASDYRLAGPEHFTGTAGYTKVDLTPVSELQLSLGNVDATLPILSSAQLTLVRPNNQIHFSMKHYVKTIGTASTLNYTTWWGHQFLTAAAAGSALAIKALRLYCGSGAAFTAGAWVNVKWIGPSAAIQTGTAIADAPSDGCEYTRVNGLWRKKSQTLVLDGIVAPAGGANATVPVGARAVKFNGQMSWNASANALSATMRWSADGTTFVAGAADYGYSGNYFGSVAGTSMLPNTSASYCLLCTSGTVANFPVKFMGHLNLARTVMTQLFHGQVYGTSFQSANHYQDLIQFWSGGGPFAALTQIKALQFGNHANPGTLSDSYVDLEWVY
jgi:hypothetical protein